MKKVNLFSLSIAVVFLFNVYSYGADRKEDIQNYNLSIKKERDSLENLNSELRKKEEAFNKEKTKKKNLSKELNNLNKKITKTEETLKKLEKDIKKNQVEQKTTEKKLSVSKDNLNNSKQNLKKELNIVHKQNLSVLLPKILIHNKTSAYFLRNNKSIEIFLNKEYESLVNTQNEINVLSHLKDNLDKKSEKIESSKKTTSVNKGKYAKDEKKKTKLLKNIEQKQIEQEKEISRLKKSSQEIEKLITDLRDKVTKLEKKRLKNLGLVKQKGNLIWPVAGDVISLFGKYKDPELNTYLFNNGIEIKIQKKCEVLAVEEGAILFANDFKSYGKTVIIEHSKNFCTVYSHLGEINVTSGDYISKKDVIGTIDFSLYFEIRLENKPEDPLLWLTSER